MRTNGVYLITGGLGDLGLGDVASISPRNTRPACSDQPHAAASARGMERGILEKGTPEDRVVRMIRGIGRSKMAGGKVMVGAADVIEPRTDARRGARGL